MLDLRDVLELIHDRFDDGALSQHDLVEHRHEPALHVRFQPGHELDSLVVKRLEERLRDVALIAEELAEHLPDQFGDGLPVVCVAGRQAQREQLAAVVDHQMEFEAEEPVDTGLAAAGRPREDFVRMNTPVVADAQRGRVNKGDAGASAFTCLQVAA